MESGSSALVARARDLSALILDACELVRVDPKYEEWIEDFNRAFPSSGQASADVRTKNISSLYEVLFTPTSTNGESGKVGVQIFCEWIKSSAPKVVFFDAARAQSVHYVEIYGVARYADFVILKRKDGEQEVEKRISLATGGLYFIVDGEGWIRPAGNEGLKPRKGQKDRKASEPDLSLSRTELQDLRETVTLTIYGNNETTPNLLRAAAALPRSLQGSVNFEIAWDPKAQSGHGGWGRLCITDSRSKDLNSDLYNQSSQKSDVDGQFVRLPKTVSELQELLRKAVDEFLPHFALIKKGTELPRGRLPVPAIHLQMEPGTDADALEWVSYAEREGDRLAQLEEERLSHLQKERLGRIEKQLLEKERVADEPPLEWPPNVILELTWLRRLEIAASEIAGRVLSDHVEHANWDHGVLENDRDRADEEDQRYVNDVKKGIQAQKLSWIGILDGGNLSICLSSLDGVIKNNRRGSKIVIKNASDIYNALKSEEEDEKVKIAQQQIHEDADHAISVWHVLKEVWQAVRTALQTPMQYALPFAFILAPLIAWLSGSSSDTAKPVNQQLQQFFRAYGVVLIPFFLLLMAWSRYNALSKKRQIKEALEEAAVNVKAREYLPKICEEVVRAGDKALSDVLTAGKKDWDRRTKRVEGRLSRLMTLQRKLIDAVTDTKDGVHTLRAQVFNSLPACRLPSAIPPSQEEALR